MSLACAERRAFPPPKPVPQRSEGRAERRAGSGEIDGREERRARRTRRREGSREERRRSSRGGSKETTPSLSLLRGFLRAVASFALAFPIRQSSMTHSSIPR